MLLYSIYLFHNLGLTWITECHCFCHR